MSRNSLISAKFITIVAHLAVASTVLWSSRESVSAYLPMGYSPALFHSQHLKLIVGLSLAIALVGLELLAFLTGVTMFDNTSALISVGCHSLACLLLTHLTLEGWAACGWYWVVFLTCSILPVTYDLTIVFDVTCNKKY